MPPSTETPFTPTSAEDFRRNRIVPVTLTTGLQIECRRLDLVDLAFVDGITMPLLQAADELQTAGVGGLGDDPDALDRRQKTRALFERIAVAAALRPALTFDDSRPDAIRVSLLSYVELRELAQTVMGLPRLTGAADVETFRQTGGAPDADPARHREDVRPAAEQPTAAESVELQHG